MNSFIILTVLIATLWLIGLIKYKVEIEPFSRNHTTFLRGVAILTVVWAHAGKDLGVNSIQWIAGIGVSIFVVLSGYGLQTSYLKNGLSHYWRKKIVNVVIPYFGVFTIAGYIVDSASFKFHVIDIITFRAQWYIGYIMICYLIFYISKVVGNRIWEGEMGWLYISFVAWFFIDTLFFTINDAPFLRARQMWAFPLGVYIANNKESSIRVIKSSKTSLICFLVGMMFMAITQLHMVKNMGVLINNIFSLFTVIPLAITVMGMSLTKTKTFFTTRFAKYLGIISFELYLVQNFSRRCLSFGKYGLLFFLIITAVGSIITYGFDITVKKIGKKIIYKAL